MSAHPEWARPYLGMYAEGALGFEVRWLGDSLAGVFPGVPEGYEIRFEPLAPPRFRMRGGPLSGTTVAFRLGTDRHAEALEASVAEFAHVPELPPDIQRYLLPPDLATDEARTIAFELLLEELLQRGDGEEFDYQLPYPKSAFLRFAAEREEILFHGSNRGDIELFVTDRSSFELGDTTDEGNLQAVYATHDGLWPMFFAVVDRLRLRGSINNGVTYFHDEANHALAVYHFSIGREVLAEQPWRPGTVYLLPRQTFRRLEFAPGVLSNEWASEVPVSPLARLAVEPEDFPFLDRVGGHDDSKVLRANELLQKLLSSVREAAMLPDGLDLYVDWDDALAAGVNELVELYRDLAPNVAVAVAPEPARERARIELTGPPAFARVVQGIVDGEIAGTKPGA